MKKQELLNLFNGLQDVSNLPGAKWAYAVARNVTKLKPEVEALQKAYQADEKFLEYENKRLKLAQKHAVKKDGKPQTIDIAGHKEYLVTDESKFNIEFEKLKKEYKEALDTRKKQVEDFNEILTEEVEVDLYLINHDYIPEGITPAQLTAIMPIVDEKETKS
jgi:hypothetical protein